MWNKGAQQQRRQGVEEALKEMVKRGRELGPLFAPAQEEINARLLSMASDLGTIHAAHARSHAALEAATARGSNLKSLGAKEKTVSSDFDKEHKEVRGGVGCFRWFVVY